MNLDQLISDETVRAREFPVTVSKVFLAHAGVAPLTRAAADAIGEFARRGAADDQESEWATGKVGETRRTAARVLGCRPSEVALLGPTALGLNLVANGIEWAPGDEVIYYPDDYPANVYPWLSLASRGVRPVPVRPREQGVIAWDTLAPLVNRRTRLVALASCNFISGYRIDVDAIGRELHKRDVLFCLDGIQTLGAFPTPLEHVDFLSADSHKWLLGPVGAGIFYVKASRQELLKPSVLGSWNVVSPDFIAQDRVVFHAGVRRYEPGTFNVPGILGMGASMQLLLDASIEAIARRLLELREAVLERMQPLGFRPLVAAANSGIVSLVHSTRDLKRDVVRLREAGIVVSLRYTRSGQPVLRTSPHFYNTAPDLDRLSAALKV
jgi:selenocysteine lyase/cysteine desulfurase